MHDSYMHDTMGLAAAQLLIAHLCHELVSPLGAVNNGVEILEDLDDAALSGDALALIAQSAKTAIAKLRFYRLAYGTAGLASDFKLADAQAVLADLLAFENRLTLDWQVAPVPPLAPGAVQLAVNLAVAALPALPRGGTLTLRASFTGRAVPFSVHAAGAGARLPPALAAALGGDAGGLDHRTAHGYYCARLAQRLDSPLDLSEGGQEVGLGTTLPLLVE